MKKYTMPSLTSRADEIVERLYAMPLERREFENGLVALHQPDFTMPVVSVQVWVRTGSIHEGCLCGSGLSHYLEHMLFKGTGRRDAPAISREVHALGGLVNAYTTFDRTVYHIDCPADAFSAALDILSDIVLHSTLPPEETARERDVILREIDMGLDDPDHCLSRALFRNAFRSHPYRDPVIGHRELFERVEHQELLDYYKSRYVPNNIAVCTAGAVSFDDCFAQVGRHFGGLPRGRLAPVPVEAEPAQLSARRETLQGDYNIVRGGIAFKVPRLSHPDSAPLDALAQALGGGESALLWERLRNQQNLVHYIDCRNWNPGESGLFWISYVCDPGRQEAVEEAVHEVVGEVCRDGLDDAVLEKAYRQAVSSEVNGRKTMSGRASRLGLGEVVVGDVHYGQRYIGQLQSVRREDLSRVADRYLKESGMTAVVAQPRTGQGSSPASASGPEGTGKNGPRCTTLSDGIRLVLQPDGSLPKVHLRAVLLGGAHYEPEDQRGISTLLAEMLIKDTDNRSASEIAVLLETLGGKFSATAGNNSIQLAIEVFPDDLPVAVELLADALLCPSFEESTFRTELDSQVAILKEADDEIFDYGFRLLREKFFSSHPFRIGPNGRAADLEALRPEAVRRYMKRIVTAPNLVLSVCGDFDEGVLHSLLANHLEGKLRRDGFQQAPGLPHFPSTVLDCVEPMEREQALVLMAFPDAGIRSDATIRGEVLHELCSGMSSRLFERVREKQGLAYYIGSTRVLGLDEGMFTLYAGTHAEAVEAVIREMRDEVLRVASASVPEEELERCRTRLKAARVMNRQTIGARAMHAGMNLAYGMPIEEDAEYAAKLDAVDASALAEFAAANFDLDKRQQLVVRPA